MSHNVEFRTNHGAGLGQEVEGDLLEGGEGDGHTGHKDEQDKGEDRSHVTAKENA